MASDDWRPSASCETLRARAHFVSQIRAFFAQRGVWEVETPILSAAAATDLHIDSFTTRYIGAGAASGRQMYLHTSPEFAMKRLLANGSGAIYQLCKVFRNGEAGRLHNPEFTMLEWYRPDFDSAGLMDEIDDLLAFLCGFGRAERVTYQQIFEHHLRLDPHRCSLSELRACATLHDLMPPGLDDDDRNGWLDFLLTHLIEPKLGRERPMFVYDYPATQAALARLKKLDGIVVADRFELYINGVEIANGYFELADVTQQLNRIERDCALRVEHKLPAVPKDERFLAALAHGLPVCSGVAVGVDRLFMIARQAKCVQEVMAFNISNA